MRNCDVVEAWRVGRTASTHRMMTDGVKLWSYSLVIGKTDDYGKKVVFDYTGGKPSHFVSMTTSCHVGLAKWVADLVEEPSYRWHGCG